MNAPGLPSRTAKSTQWWWGQESASWTVQMVLFWSQVWDPPRAAREIAMILWISSLYWPQSFASWILTPHSDARVACPLCCNIISSSFSILKMFTKVQRNSLMLMWTRFLKPCLILEADVCKNHCLGDIFNTARAFYLPVLDCINELY